MLFHLFFKLIDSKKKDDIETMKLKIFFGTQTGTAKVLI